MFPSVCYACSVVSVSLRAFCLADFACPSSLEKNLNLWGRIRESIPGDVRAAYCSMASVRALMSSIISIKSKTEQNIMHTKTTAL